MSSSCVAKHRFASVFTLVCGVLLQEQNVTRVNASVLSHREQQVHRFHVHRAVRAVPRRARRRRVPLHDIRLPRDVRGPFLHLLPLVLPLTLLGG